MRDQDRAVGCWPPMNDSTGKCCISAFRALGGDAGDAQPGGLAYLGDEVFHCIFPWITCFIPVHIIIYLLACSSGTGRGSIRMVSWPPSLIGSSSMAPPRPGFSWDVGRCLPGSLVKNKSSVKERSCSRGVCRSCVAVWGGWVPEWVL